MTLSTRAEHERGREESYVADEIERDVVPFTVAEAHVMDLEGTEDDPTVVTDPEWQARQVADEVQAEATDAARCYTDDSVVAESVGREMGNEAYQATLDGLRGSPCIEVVEDDE